MIVNLLLWTNAVLYAGFAAWCTIAPQTVMRFLGQGAVAKQGSLEFITVYGGLQAGLAAFYALAALSPSLQRPAVIFSICLYAGIVLWRTVGLFVIGLPDEKGIFLVYALECVLLIWSLAAGGRVVRL